MANKRIIMVSMGACGNAVATAFIDTMLAECGVGPGGEPPADPALAEALTVFCDRRADGRLVPRRLLAATVPDYSRYEEGPDDRYLALDGSRYAGLYPAEARLLEAKEFGGDNWAKGYKAPTVETLVQRVRDRIAALHGDCVVWLFHGLGGGYGAGAGSRLLEEMASEYGGTVPLVSIAVAPSLKVSDTVVQPYNAVLALHGLLRHADQTLLFDNEALYNLVFRTYRVPTPTYRDLNAVIATALLTLVSPLLWPGADGRRLAAEALHAGLWNAPPGANWDWASADGPAMRPQERLVAIANWVDAAPADSDAGLAGRLVGGQGGLLSGLPSGVWIRMLAIRQGGPGDAAGFAAAIPGGHARLALDPRSGQRRAIAAGGHTVLAETLGRLLGEFVGMWRRKAFLHWYTGEGLNDRDMTEAESAVHDAIREIQAAAAREEAPTDDADSEEAPTDDAEA